MAGLKELGKNRVEALTDGIYAIVLTLGVLTIDISELPPPGDNLDIYNSLTSIFPQILYYAIAFFVLISFWMAHHRMMDCITHVDNIFNWMNMVALFFVALVPFTTDLMGYYDEYSLAVEIYAANLLVIGALQTGLWYYITSKGGFLKTNISKEIILTSKLRGLACPIVALIVMLYAWLISAEQATILFLLIPVVSIILNRIIAAEIAEENNMKA